MNQEIKQNNAYPFSLLNDSVSLGDKNYTLASTNKNSILGFTNLQWDNTNTLTLYEFGKIITYTTTDDANYLDDIRNHSVLEDYRKLYNKTVTDELFKTDFISQLKILETIANEKDNIENSFSINYKIGSLYNDYVDTKNSILFCEKIYRAKQEKELEAINGKIFNVVPVFTLITTDTNEPLVYLKMRDFKVAMKTIKTSPNHYICLAPEYILNNYSDYQNAISYISIENVTVSSAMYNNEGFTETENKLIGVSNCTLVK